jgi:hypothetical protein
MFTKSHTTPINPRVIVWNKNRRQPTIHLEGCPTLSRSVIPPRTTPFRGEGTAGWLPLNRAREVAVECRACM